MNTPAPKLFTRRPFGSNSKTDGSVDPSHEFAPQRSATHRFPFGAMSIALVDPHVRPSGICPQRSVVVYGLGGGGP